jgi:hypothetical protein
VWVPSVITQVRATRYVTPLREGGSLPGVMEADDLGTYVVKFRGAGQGLRVLVAEVIVAELARRLGIRVPDVVGVELADQIAKYEADEEVQDLLTASLGLNLGIDFLPGAFGYDASCALDPDEAAAILWLDAYVANVDRSWRNPNLLVWHRQVWAIDHGAALYFHHAWPNGLTSPERFAHQPYDARDHVLIGFVDELPAMHERLARQVDRRLLDLAVAQVPDDWLEPVPGAADVGSVRTAYVDFMLARLEHPGSWLPQERAA